MIHQGDSLTVLRTLPEASVNCCITSPPYWGLRDYGADGQLGLEATPAGYVSKLVEVFREVRRVLRDDGTLWLNLGDSYSAQPPGKVSGDAFRTSGLAGSKTARVARESCQSRPPRQFPGLKSKDLIGIPWRVALALQADGWWLRSDIIWHKPNPMPESVTDRPTKAHEYLFLLAKSERYHYDHEAIKEPSICGDPRKPYAPGQVDNRGDGHARGGGKVRPSVERGRFNGKTEAMAEEGRNAFRAVEDWRNKRSVWTLATLPTPEAHFATFPIELPEICLKAGCPEGGMVLDPFAGAGTTGLACLKNNRNFVGIELNPSYVDIAYDRARKYYPLFLDCADQTGVFFGQNPPEVLI